MKLGQLVAKTNPIRVERPIIKVTKTVKINRTENIDVYKIKTKVTIELGTILFTERWTKRITQNNLLPQTSFWSIFFKIKTHPQVVLFFINPQIIKISGLFIRLSDYVHQVFCVVFTSVMEKTQTSSYSLKSRISTPTILVSYIPES